VIGGVLGSIGGIGCIPPQQKRGFSDMLDEHISARILIGDDRLLGRTLPGVRAIQYRGNPPEILAPVKIHDCRGCGAHSQARSCSYCGRIG